MIVDHNMPSGKDCAVFFNNTENKKDLFEIPSIINSSENTWRITKDMTEFFPITNHVEADTAKLQYIATFFIPPRGIKIIHFKFVFQFLSIIIFDR